MTFPGAVHNKLASVHLHLKLDSNIEGMYLFPLVSGSTFSFLCVCVVFVFFFREATRAGIPSKRMELRITDTYYMSVGHGGECGTSTNLLI